MKLSELEAHFCRWYERDPDPSRGESVNQGKVRGYKNVATLAEADGLFMLCPLCFKTNNGPVGTHGVLVAFRNAPDGSYVQNKEGRWPKWDATGTSLDDLSCTPSILLIGGCGWHGFVGSNGVPPGEAA